MLATESKLVTRQPVGVRHDAERERLADANPDDFDDAFESDDASEEEYINAADASRMGKAVEHLVAAACILSTRGNLNVSTSLVDDEGVDLVFHARDSVRTLAVQVKARMSDSKTVRTKQRFIAMVREATFTPRDDLAMLFVLADVVEGRYTTAWLVPSKEFASRAQVRSDGKTAVRGVRKARHEGSVGQLQAQCGHSACRGPAHPHSLRRRARLIVGVDAFRCAPPGGEKTHARTGSRPALLDVLKKVLALT